jgi:hypothetical protein
VGFETTTPASERTKIIHALDHAATVTGSAKNSLNINKTAWGNWDCYSF